MRWSSWSQKEQESPCRRAICRSGRSGWPARCARPSACRCGSSRRFFAAASTSSPRAARSTSRARAPRSDLRHASGSATGSVARWIGTGRMAGFNSPDDPTTGGASTTSVSGKAIGRIQDQLSAAGKSARTKYTELVVGRPGLASLLKYEFVVTLAQPRAGALGLALRKTLYPWLLGSCGRNVVFGQNVVLRHPHKIHIGRDVVIDDNCLLDAKGETNRGIRIGDGVFIGRNTILSCKNGDIELGDA